MHFSLRRWQWWAATLYSWVDRPQGAWLIPINTSEAPLRYLALSSRADAEVAEYPDSGKVGAYGRDDDGFAFLAPASAAVDYFDGEDGEA